MSWYPAYINKQELVDFIKTQRPKFTVADIFDVDIKFADTTVFSYLYNFGKIKIIYDGDSSGNTPDIADQLNLLWAASLAFNCEMLSYRGVISYNVGGIQQVKAGDIVTQFMRMQPMFFMGNNPTNLDGVMPFRSFKQIGQHFLETFIIMHNADKGVKWGQPVFAWDPTSRGFAWNANLTDYMELYDAELTGSSL